MNAWRGWAIPHGDEKAACGMYTWLESCNTIKSTQLCHYYVCHGGGGVGLRGPDDCPIVDLISPTYKMRLEYKEKVKKGNEVIITRLPYY